VIVRVEDGRVLMDLRTVAPEQDMAVALTIAKIAKRES
jgi:hypothetical protein